MKNFILYSSLAFLAITIYEKLCIDDKEEITKKIDSKNSLFDLL